MKNLAHNSSIEVRAKWLIILNQNSVFSACHAEAQTFLVGA